MWKRLSFRHQPNPVQGEGATPQEEWARFVAGFDFFLLMEAWREIVGDMLARDSLPLRLKNHTLFILTSHPGISSNMKYAEPLILTKIYARFPETKRMLTKLSFEANEAFFKEKVRPFLPRRDHSLHKHSPLYKKLRAEAEKLFAEVSDPEERECWISLYIQSCQTNDPHSS